MNNDEISSPGLAERGRLIWRSFTSLPLWVQVWVALILVPSNALAFLMLDTLAGQWTALAALFVVITNLPIMFAYCGMNRAMSIPHLIAWVPLQIALALRLAGGVPGTTETAFIVIILLINGLSLVFDTIDSVRWFAGERETPGID